MKQLACLLLLILLCSCTEIVEVKQIEGTEQPVVEYSIDLPNAINLNDYLHEGTPYSTDLKTLTVGEVSKLIEDRFNFSCYIKQTKGYEQEVIDLLGHYTIDNYRYLDNIIVNGNLAILLSEDGYVFEYGLYESRVFITGYKVKL